MQTQAGCKSDECSHEYAWIVYGELMNGEPWWIYTCQSLAELDGRGCGYLPNEWHGENTGIQQVIRDKPENIADEIK
jgi:hypothetical protein